ncbi:unnamed protein product [Leptidea sinapis]|uniref:Uncharacterized protein n=1 Tax=Leptidea sinapis TaxID=189913 RepID=A0A5E4Q9P0_9NEOP|nr:unnamed protein product [Leptidea sinapis]
MFYERSHADAVAFIISKAEIHSLNLRIFNLGKCPQAYSMELPHPKMASVHVVTTNMPPGREVHDRLCAEI